MTAPIADTKLWEKLAAPIPTKDIQWRIDGKPTERQGKYVARFVAFVDAQFVRERLDSILAGNWDLTLELLPPIDIVGREGQVTGKEFAFKSRLQILGVIREDVGTGDDYKSASSDAFKRVAVRFGVATELYSYEQNWVEVDGDGKYAKPVEDPNVAYQRRHGSGAKQSSGVQNGATPDYPGPGVPAGAAPAPSLADTLGPCPKCGGRVWDNRLTKRNQRAPDGKCQNRSCDGVIWPPKAEDSKRPVATNAGIGADPDSYPDALYDEPGEEPLPF